MDDYQLLIDLHKRADRQGPGSDAMTLRALALSGIDPSAPLRIADVGCGTGASTLMLAGALNAAITAVDFIDEFLTILSNRADEAGLGNKISTLACSMEELPFEEEAFDVIWSEGAIYNIGFENGITAWRRFLKPGGILAVSEITWTTGDRPEEIQQHWEREYPEIAPASSKIRLLEEQGFAPVGYFTLPESCWLDQYYVPMEQGFEDFMRRNGNSAEARAIVEAEIGEINLYRKYRDFYSYGFYIAKKAGHA